jgi:hypothetical protein
MFLNCDLKLKMSLFYMPDDDRGIEHEDCIVTEINVEISVAHDRE